MITKLLNQLKVNPPEIIKPKKPLTKEEILEKRKTEKEKIEIETKFYDIMFELGLHDKARNTYNLYLDEKTSYGWKGRIFLVPPLTFKKLSEYTHVFEENLKCIWIIKYGKFSDCAYIQIVTKPLDSEFEYENPNIKPWQLYMGLNLALNPIINNNNSRNMFLIAGSTGSGKTRFIHCILLSFILGCSVNEVELYLADIAKDEFVNFRYVKHVRYYASELEQLYKMVKALKVKFEKRKAIISKAREDKIATNIEEYNKVSKTKMSYVYILIDEASIIMPKSGESKEKKAMKEEIEETLGDFSKTCRSYGMFPIIATQKTVNAEINPIIRDMAAVRISFRANSGKSSESILGDDSAVGLLDRYAIYSLDGGCTKDYLFSPKITTERLNQLLEPHIDKNFKKLDVDAIIKEANQPPQPSAKCTPIPKQPKKEKTHHYPVVKLLDKKEREDDYDDYQ